MGCSGLVLVVIVNGRSMLCMISALKPMSLASFQYRPFLSHFIQKSFNFDFIGRLILLIILQNLFHKFKPVKLDVISKYCLYIS